MCHAIIEIRFRSDATDDDSTLARAIDESHLSVLVASFKENDQIIRIRVYRPDARWDRVEEWKFEE